MDKKRESHQIKRERNIGFGFGVAIGVFSSWVVYGFYSSWSIFDGAKWWELFSVLGTVGATALALYFGLVSRNAERVELERRRKAIALDLYLTLQRVENTYNTAQIYLFVFQAREQKENIVSKPEASEIRKVVDSIDKSKEELLKMPFNDASLIEGLISSIRFISTELNEATRLIEFGRSDVGDFRKEVKEGSKCFYSAADEVAALKMRAERIINS